MAAHARAAMLLSRRQKSKSPEQAEQAEGASGFGGGLDAVRMVTHPAVYPNGN